MLGNDRLEKRRLAHRARANDRNVVGDGFRVKVSDLSKQRLSAKEPAHA